MPRDRDANELAPIFGAAELVATDSPFPGVTRGSYRSAKATLVSYAFAPGAEFPQHAHAEEQITTVSDGDVEFVVAGTSYQLRAGETFVVGPGIAHGLRAGSAGARFLAVVLPPRIHPDAYTVT